MSCVKIVNDKPCGKKTKIQVAGEYVCAKCVKKLEAESDEEASTSEPPITDQVREIYKWMLEVKKKKPTTKKVKEVVVEEADVEQLQITKPTPKKKTTAPKTVDKITFQDLK